MFQMFERKLIFMKNVGLTFMKHMKSTKTINLKNVVRLKIEEWGEEVYKKQFARYI